ncbi:MAG: DUF3616 domain-containing protein [Cyanobium sp.]|jgi:hypothetical protein
MAPIPFAVPSLQRRLHLGDADDSAAADLRDNLSGLAAGDGWLWLAGDEGRSLHRLQAEASGGYGHSSRIKLADFGLAGGKAEGESDLEGLALDGDRLWLVGSHSLRRRRHDSDKGEPLALDPQRSTNAQVLGCLHLDGRGFPRIGQRLRSNTTNSGDALTAALASEPLLRPFLPIPSKDNGLDIEGITARGDRLLLGLRGPVLRGIALVVELHLAGLGEDNDSGESGDAKAHGSPLRLASHQLHFLELGGLAVRDLALLPGGNDVLILAGPTMTLAGPCLLYRWREPFRSDAPAAGAPPEITVHTPEPLLWIRDGAPGPGHNKPEGLQLERIDGHLIAWVAYDNPDPNRRRGTGCCTRLDGFLLPEALG